MDISATGATANQLLSRFRPRDQLITNITSHSRSADGKHNLNQLSFDVRKWSLNGVEDILAKQTTEIGLQQACDLKNFFAINVVDGLHFYLINDFLTLPNEKDDYRGKLIFLDSRHGMYNFN